MYLSRLLPAQSMYTMNTSIIPDETYGYYPSEFIVGRHNSVPHKVAEICFREAIMLEFWRSVISFISQSTSGNLDGQVYTSDQMDVFLGPYDVKIVHQCNRCGKERFEVTEVHDFGVEGNLPGAVYKLNRFYNHHENTLLNYKNHNYGKRENE